MNSGSNHSSLVIREGCLVRPEAKAIPAAISVLMSWFLLAIEHEKYFPSVTIYTGYALAVGILATLVTMSEFKKRKIVFVVSALLFLISAITYGWCLANLKLEWVLLRICAFSCATLSFVIIETAFTRLPIHGYNRRIGKILAKLLTIGLLSFVASGLMSFIFLPLFWFTPLMMLSCVTRLAVISSLIVLPAYEVAAYLLVEDQQRGCSKGLVDDECSNSKCS